MRTNTQRTRAIVASALVLMFMAGTAMADGQDFKRRTGAFGKGGPRNVSAGPVLVSSQTAPTTQEGEKYVWPINGAEWSRHGQH